jgi:tetratricopeptide (TPR) repeat protein
MGMRRGRAKERPAGASERRRTRLGQRNQAPLRKVDSATIVPRGAGMWALMLSATLFAYLPALHGGLLWDDSSHVTRPGLQSLHGLWRIWSDLGATQQYYPLLHTAFWLEHRTWGDAVLGYHLANLALHALSACLVVMIARRLSLPGAWLAGFVFALHPVCVEAVAWISEQKSALSGVFYLAAALTYLHFDQTRRKSQYFMALGLFVLALMSKTVTATLPAALLVVFWWQRGRIEWKRDLPPLLPWFAVGASAGLFTAWVERTFIGAEGADFALTLPRRLLLAGRVPWFYAGKLLWPSNLMFSYPHWKIDPRQWWQSLFPLGLVVLAAALGLLARRNRGPLAGFLIFAGTLFPVLGFLNVFPFRYSYVADHFQYLASLGIIVPATSGLMAAAGRIAPGKTGTIALAVLLLVPLGLLTWRQSGVYRDEETLYRETLARNPDSFFVHNDLGAALFLMPGRLLEATAEFEAAARLKPDSPEAHQNLANALAALPDRLPDAIAQYREALRLKPDFADAHDNLGNALAALPGRLPDAIAEYQAALRIEPDFAVAHDNLGNALAKLPGRLADAIAEYQAALRVKPDFAEAHSNLGNAWSQTPGRLPDAIAEYQAALRIRPDIAVVHFNLGNTFSEMPGRLPDAIAEYRAALGIDPDVVEVHNNLGYALSRTPGGLPAAIAEFRAALRINPDSANAHLNLGNALAQIPSRLPEAIAEYEAVLRIQPDPEVRRIVERLRAGRR